MKVKSEELTFEWDEGNLDKSRRKHGVTPEEAESVLVDETSLIIPDQRHSKIENRFIVVGSSDKKRNVFIVFTMRKGKIRVISARRMHKKEVQRYGKT
ncbi:BrnT family toxin [Candidatus Gottesmanbacteria bacterium]|nr:BrnT family toxin [Candidatus Gottesmanbacteria bacterium]